MTQIGFRGAVISKRNPPFARIITSAYERETKALVSNSTSINLDPKSWQKPANEQDILTLWGKDNKAFCSFLKKNSDKIEISPQDKGLPRSARLSKLSKEEIKASKLAQALTNVLNIPVISNAAQTCEVLNNRKTLTSNVLTKKILTNALKLINLNC